MRRRLNNKAETEAFAVDLAATLKPGNCVGLTGELGAGKSVFARAVMRALGVKDRAMPSPTFSLIQEYAGGGCKIAHMDWFRLASPDEIEALGVRDYFKPPWICLIEWPERAPELLPDTAIGVKLECVEDNPDARLIGIRRAEAAD